MKTGPLMKVGRYEVQEKIGAGGMATVYRAIQTGIGGFRSIVALKLLHPELARDKQFRKMFLEEGRIGALLNHRCLLQVTDFGEEEGFYYLVSEYFPSVTLEELIRKARKLPLSETLFVLAEAAEGLDALHSAVDLDGKELGLVHRDVSPHNLLVGFDGRVKLIDFGIVKQREDSNRTRAGVVKGKCRYMSPEQAGGKRVSPQSDIYSLGVVFVRTLTGGRPFGQGSTGEILARARGGLDWEPLVARLGLPENVMDILRGMLAPDNNARYKSGMEVAEAARKALATVSSPYDSHSFVAWLQRVVRKSDQADKSTTIPPTGRRKAKKVAPAATVVQPIEPSRLDIGGIHPRWIFVGMGILVLASLLAMGIDKLS